MTDFFNLTLSHSDLLTYIDIEGQAITLLALLVIAVHASQLT